MMKTLNDVLVVWFGADYEHATPQDFWFKKNPTFDEQLRVDFGGLYDWTVAQTLEPAPTAWTALARVVLLDQFARNMYRGTPRMYVADPMARQCVELALEADQPSQVPPVCRTFFWMPWMHSEDLADQERCVAVFEAMGEEGTANLPYAEQHRDIIARFGRFPHRNAILGRTSTPEELAFLEEDGSSF